MVTKAEGIPTAVRKYASSMGLKVNDPRVQKYAMKMRGRKADDEIIEGPTSFRPALEDLDQSIDVNTDREGAGEAEDTRQ